MKLELLRRGDLVLGPSGTIYKVKKVTPTYAILWSDQNTREDWSSIHKSRIKYSDRFDQDALDRFTFVSLAEV